MKDPVTVKISGAGPAGLAAALAVLGAGGRARVYERRSEVGGRFHGDFQGLENWTLEQDVLEEFAALGIDAAFEHVPVREVVCYDPDGRERVFRSTEPLFYLVHRGAGAGSLDQALKRQALAEGAEILFETPLRRLPRGGVVTEGPHRADAIASGYLFETDMADGIYAVVSDDLAPKGYAYLLISRGRATLATCLFADFHNERRYLERSVEFFDRHVGLRMQRPRRFGGSGNFSLPKSARKGNILYAGEAAGFQDPLFGFGMRCAILSGAAAGRALATGDPASYERFWKRRLRAWHQTSATNRWFYRRLGNRGYRLALQGYHREKDVRDWMRRSYAPRAWKRIWYQLAVARRETPLLRTDRNCDCTWCRCCGTAGDGSR